MEHALISDARREDVWEILSDLFVDNEIDYEDIVSKVADIDFAQLKDIFLNEVTPYCGPNFMTPAPPVWAFFDREELIKGIRENLTRINNSWFAWVGYKAGVLFYRCWLWFVWKGFVAEWERFKSDSNLRQHMPRVARQDFFTRVNSDYSTKLTTYPLHTTLAERHAAISNSNSFTVELPLYVLIDREGRTESTATKTFGVFSYHKQLAFVSPVDAMINILQNKKRGYPDLELSLLELFSSGHFIDANNCAEKFYLAHGFTASNNKLFVDVDSEIRSLTTYTEFSVQQEGASKPLLKLKPAFRDWLNQKYQEAGMPDYEVIHKNLAEMPLTEIERIATEAIQRVEGTVADVKQCAFYDPVNKCWRFAAYDDLNDGATGVSFGLNGASTRTHLYL